MLKISYAGCLGLSPAISSQFSVEMCAESKNCEKFTKNLFLRGSRSFKVIDVDESKKPVTSACCDKQHVCTYLQPFSHYSSQSRTAINNGKMTFLGGYSSMTPSFEGNPCTHTHSLTGPLDRRRVVAPSRLHEHRPYPRRQLQ